MSKPKTTLTILNIPGTDVLVIKKSDPDSNFFITSKDSFIISKAGLITLLNYMLKNGFIDERVIKGLLEEYHTL